MVDFRNRKRFETREPVLKVDPGLALGSYVFQLTVVDNAGARSKPIRLRVEIVKESVVIDPRLATPISREPVVVAPDINP